MTHERYFRVGAYATIKAERERGPWNEVLRVTPERGRFLDVGCSAGLLLRLLEELRPHLALTGLDYSRSGVYMASLLARSAHVVVGDAQRLPFADAAFDVVYSGHLIEHLVDPLLTLREQRRVLAKGGRLIVQFPHADLRYVEHVHDNIVLRDVVHWLKAVGFWHIRAGRIIRGPPVDDALVWARK
jgi:SAM-dependent methyltransferase